MRGRIRIPGLEGGVRGEVAGGVLLGGPEDAGAPLLVAALGRSPGRARCRRHFLLSLAGHQWHSRGGLDGGETEEGGGRRRVKEGRRGSEE